MDGGVVVPHRGEKRGVGILWKLMVASISFRRYVVEQLNRRNLARFVVLGCVLAGVNHVVDTVQRQLIYFPQPRDPREIERSDSALGRLGYEVRDFAYAVKPRLLGSALQQRGLLVVPKTASLGIDNLWVLFGGNAMVSTDWLPFLETLLSAFSARAGKSQAPGFLLLDYPGYGRNQGSVCAGVALRSALAGVEAALRTLRGQSDCDATAPSLPREPAAIAFLGHSLGAAAVAQLAAALAVQQPTWLGSCSLGKVVLSAPFTSIPAMGQVLFGGVPGSNVILGLLAVTSRHAWDNCRSLRTFARAMLQKAASADVPTISIVHGTSDEVVPVNMGRALWKLCKQAGLQKCDFIERPRAGHNDILGEALSEYARIIFDGGPTKSVVAPTPNL